MKSFLVLSLVPIVIDAFVLTTYQTSNPSSAIYFRNAFSVPTIAFLSVTAASDDPLIVFPEEANSFELDPDSEFAHYLMNTKLQLSERQQQQLLQYCDLLVEWNEKINLISRRDCNRNVVFGMHILPCLAPLLLDDGFRISDGSRVADIGTGGGLPGIPLAICYPEANFLLVDSVGKKLKAVDDMIDQLGLDNAWTQHNRAEQVVTSDGKTRECVDWCVGRSVASLPKFCSSVHHLLKQSSGKLLYIIGGDVPESNVAECDEPIHDLFVSRTDKEYGDLISEKRLLVFSQKNVLEMAKSSDNYRNALQMQKMAGKSDANSNKGKQAKSKVGKAKGAWNKKRDQPKQRGYEDFQRYNSN